MVRLPRLSVTLSAYPSSELRPKTLTFFFGLNLKPQLKVYFGICSILFTAMTNKPEHFTYNSTNLYIFRAATPGV